RPWSVVRGPLFADADVRTWRSMWERSNEAVEGTVGGGPTTDNEQRTKDNGRRTRGMETIREKVEAGRRLSFEDGLALEASNDLFALGSMANLVRERYNGNYAYYNVNTHINPTNVCVYTCDFCAFRADLGEDRAYVMDRDQITERARQASA